MDEEAFSKLLQKTLQIVDLTCSAKVPCFNSTFAASKAIRPYGRAHSNEPN